MTRRTNRVLAVAAPDGDEAVLGVADALAALLPGQVRRFEIGAVPQPVDAERVLEQLADDTVALAVVPGVDLRQLDWAVLQGAGKPVVVVPAAYRPRPIGRALIPLDGTPESAAAVEETIDLLARGGVDVLVLHVFQPETVPKFWDHPGHAEALWQQEFLARYCDRPGVRLRVRSGTPGEHVLDVAAAEHVDLVALGWSQHLDSGRARTLRHTVEHAPMPTLIVPVTPRP